MSELVNDMENVSAVVLEINGKEYRIVGELNTSAGMLVNANVQILSKIFSDNPTGQDPEENDKAMNVLVHVIARANKVNNPELTPEFITKHFEVMDYQMLGLLYLNAWSLSVEKTRSKVDPPKDAKKNEADG